MYTDIHKRFVYIRSAMQFYKQYPDRNIFLPVYKNELFPDIFWDF